MRAVVLLIVGSLVSAPAFAGVWGNLWRTPDQQGEALLGAGRPAAAARRFTDPRLKAYADLRAGHYGAAARLLAPLKDPTSEYNRGNALAHIGHLRQALADYDAALKQAPNNADILHNRNLVRRMLAHRRPPRSSPSGHRHSKSGSGGTGPTRKRHGGRSKASHGASGAGHAGRSGAGGRQPGRRRPAAGPAGSSGHAGTAKPGTTTHSNASVASRPGQESAGAANAQPAPSTGPGRRSPAQMRRNAALAASLARRQASPLARGRRTHGLPLAARGLVRNSGGERPPKPPKPVSEKTLALEQWLRQLPNNPAGLLRREFLIKYMMRHPGAGQ